MTLRFPSKKAGFAAVTLMLFFPLVLALLFSISFLGYLIQYKTGLRSLCLTEATRIQKNLIRNEEALFKLNAPAQTLRTRLRLAYAERATALASKNPALIAEAELKISQIKSAQAELDQLQKGLLQKTKLELQSASSSLISQLRQKSQTMNSIWQFYLDSFTSVSFEHQAKVSVQPDSAEPAPVYELTSDYFEQQRLAYRWHHDFQTKESAQKLLHGENQIDMFCAVSARKERTAWHLSISAVRF